MWFKPVLAFPEGYELNLCRVSRRNYSAVLLFFFTCAMLAMAQPAPDKPKPEDELAQWITANYTKFEYRIAIQRCL